MNRQPNTGKKPLLRRIRRFISKLIVIFIGISLFFTLLYRFVEPPLTPLMVKRFFQQAIDDNRSLRFKRDYVDIEDISPNLINAVVAAEDGKFMEHNGFDFDQLKKSYEENKSNTNGRIRGGSTISMQTAKNAFLPHHRTYLRKAFEAYFTVLIELMWSKERIMEVYLNIVEFGDGIYGCEAAAQHYFGKSAKNLTRNEAAQLAVTLPSPLKRNPHKATPYFKKRTAIIARRMTKVNLSPIEKQKKGN